METKAAQAMGTVDPDQSVLGTVQRQVGRRARQVADILSKGGYREIVDRVRSKASDMMRPRGVVWPVFPEDVMKADLTRPKTFAVPQAKAGEPIAVNWVVGAAGPGSGGHTTLYRIVKYLEKNGYINRVYFYSPFGGDQKYYEDIARESYGLTCEIGSVLEGMRDAHAVVAADWASAYAVYNASCSGKRFYFVQDYEPYFYPVGTNSALAENTYRMGFHGITAGRWLAEKLSRDFGMATDHFPFGCDTAKYRYDAAAKRDGIAFYARAGTPRRAVELGLLALELFARRQPQVELHLFGEKMGSLGFKFTNHGLVTPAKLNEIYNRCFAGLSLSLTNVSLVPHEMMACGCIPIVNDADHNRMVLDNPHVAYAPSTPHALADAMEKIVTGSDFERVSRAAAASITGASWDKAGAAVDAAFRKALREQV